MAPARDNPPIADEVSWSETSYDRYLNGQADSSHEDRPKYSCSAVTSTIGGDEIDFSPSRCGGCNGQAA
jgi:hypothetical protein